MSGGKLKVSFWVDKAEFFAIEDAARDAHMELADYCRLMVLCAAGMGGVMEHLERASDASERVDRETQSVFVPAKEAGLAFAPCNNCWIPRVCMRKKKCNQEQP